MKRSYIVRGLQAGIGLALGFGIFLGYQQWTGNVHTVIPGRLYRSGTLATDRFADMLDRNGIRTVINLRGTHVGTPWYDGERAEAAKRDVQLVDLAWSASQELDDGKVETFFEVVENAPEPILIHCMSGSDRTGLAVALFLAKFAKSTEEEAEAQLSIRFGHLAIPFLSRAYAMDATFERLEPSLGFSGS